MEAFPLNNKKKREKSWEWMYSLYKVRKKVLSPISRINVVFSNASTVYCVVLLRFYYHFIVIAQIGEYTFIAAWVIIDANSLSMSQQGFVKVVDRARIWRQEGLQKAVRVISGDFFTKKSQTS